MIVRRIREHVAHYNWFAVAIDLAIVVAGVFLGMQVNNWNQARLDRLQAHEYREMLIGDLQTNLQNLAMRKRYYQWVRREAIEDTRRDGRSAAFAQASNFWSIPTRPARSFRGR